MTEAGTTREAVAVFEDVADLDEAIAELKKRGFVDGAFSLLANRQTVEAKLGHAYERVEELEDDPKAPRVAYQPRASTGDADSTFISALTYAPPLLAAGAIVASSGLATGLIVGAAVGGTLLATALGRAVDKDRAEWLQDQLDRGGILLWVRTPSDNDVAVALEVLTQHAIHDAHVHDIPVDT